MNFFLEYIHHAILSVFFEMQLGDCAEMPFCPSICPHNSCFVPTRNIDMDLEVQDVFASLCCLFWNVKLFGRKKNTETHSSSCGSCVCDFLSHTILLNWPWDYCESVKMRMTSSNMRHNFFTHECCRISACGLLTQYLELNFTCVILFALSYFLKTFCDVTFHFSRDYAKLCVWTEHGNRMRSLAV